MAILCSECRVRLDLSNGDSSLYPVKNIGLLMRQMSYSKPALLSNSVKGSGYLQFRHEIAGRTVESRPCYFVLLQMLYNLNLRVIEVEAGSEGYVNVEKLTVLFRCKSGAGVSHHQKRLQSARQIDS